MKRESISRNQSIVALAIGVIALVASFIIPYGGLLGIVGIVVASKAVRKGAYRRNARFGMIISVLAIVFMIFLFLSPAFPHSYPFEFFTHSTTALGGD